MIRRTVLNQSTSIHATLRRHAAPQRLSRHPFYRSSFTSPQRSWIASRWHSASAEQNTSTAQDSASQPTSEGGASAAEDAVAQEQAQVQEDPKAEELEKKNREIIDLKDRYLRQVAEFRNLQERTKREVQAAKDFALQRFAKDLIDSVDNLDRALLTVPEDKIDADNKDLVNLRSGLKMTDTILMQTLKKHGLERFDPSDTKEKFDPNRHEATFQVPQPDKEDGTVFHTQQKGWALNGRVIRAPKVGVVKNS
ncbi:mitochondrial co-chaperone GrpE [Viridothelium virens]|uniref:GrpE protein homolog, mitochondrial n=1 Tax=Viridothelium virens TaxID=1048519 RepID=A0A6A6HEL0_VIRVR|nr:mitochondrial co-chaperone GrpE [Viridothelium virens]